MEFELHPKLKQDLVPLSSDEHMEVMYLPNGELPWIVLIPKVANIKEIYQLPDADQQRLYRLINDYSQKIQTEFKCDKINVAAFGNMVPQLHIHVLGRYSTDSAWPGSVFGMSLKQDKEQQEKTLKKIKSLF